MAKKKKAVKKRNHQDAGIRNVQASNKDDARHDARIRMLEKRMKYLDKRIEAVIDMFLPHTSNLKLRSDKK